MFLVTVATIWGIAAITPGPNFLVVARCALTGGRPTALAAVSGVVSGTFVWGLAGWLGISALFAAAPVAFLAVKILGGAYILWLGLRLLHASLWRRSVPATPRVRAGLGVGPAFRLGLATNLANPKTALFVSSLFAAALPADCSFVEGLLSVATMVVVSAVWYTALAVSLSGERAGLAFLRARRLIDAATGAVFVGFGARLLLSGR